jgi:hypothetical protein
MDIEKSGNLIEAVVWLFVSTVFALKAIRAAGSLRRAFWILSASFFVFATSDLIESETGAWWRPWWLLAMKAICVAGFVLGFAGYFKITLRPHPSSTQAGPSTVLNRAPHQHGKEH